MKRVENLSISKMPRGYKDYPDEIRATLAYKFGLSGIAGNFEGERELSEKEVDDVAELISSVDGRMKVYQQWQFPDDENFWRLCLGYE